MTKLTATPKIYRVGVFDDDLHPKRKPMAYTRAYSPDWPGCCEHRLVARTGAEAKKMAIAEHVINCRSGPTYHFGRRFDDESD